MSRSLTTAICAMLMVAGLYPPPAADAVVGDVTGAVDIGAGRSMFVECRGTGSPTVILMSGKGNGAEDWLQVLAPDDPAHDSPGDDLPWGFGELIRSQDAVLPSVARFTRVCAYDRPDVRFEGADLTTPRSQPHPVDLDVADLDALLTAVGAEGPSVLVAHSYSGVVATLFTRTHPEKVAGLVMVDALSEHMADVLSPAQLDTWDASNAATSPQVAEGVRVIDAFQQIDAAPPMPAIPAVALAADKPWRTDLLPPESLSSEQVTFEDWRAGQDRLATSLGVELITATDSGHDIYLYHPSLVVDAIERVVEEVRAGV